MIDPHEVVGCVIFPDDTNFDPTPVPLTGVDVRVAVVGPATRVTVVQTYENREEIPIEATYLFPLEEGSAVCGFAVTIDGHRLEGRVKERDAAFDEYDDAMAEGRGAFLLDQERPNLFTASIGNLLPTQTVQVELTYVSELPRAGDGFRLALPQGITPRYVPTTRHSGEGMDDAERLDAPRASGELGYAWNLTIDVDLLGPIAELTSPSHRIETHFDGRRAIVTLAEDDRRPDRDFVLKLVPQEKTTRAAVVEHDGEHYAVFDVRADVGRERHSVDVTFVVDCSGSMHGESIRDARRTLALFLRSLHPGDRFEVVRFGSDFERYFDGWRDYDDDSLKEASRRVERMEADLGGTEILSPLNAVLGRTDGERPHRVVLITDGAVGNEDEVIDLCRRHANTTRVYAFGVGHGASEHLVRGVARVTGGAAEFVVPGERIEDKVMRHAERIARDSVRNLTVQGEDVQLVDLQPFPLPSLDTVAPATLFARVTGGAGGTVTLKGRCGAGAWEQHLELASAPDVDAALVATLWARGRIRQLEDDSSWAERWGSQQHRRRKAREKDREKDVAAELIVLGERFGLVSRATSYVVVDDRPDAPRAQMPAGLRRVPIAGAPGGMPILARMVSPTSASMPVSDSAGREHVRSAYESLVQSMEDAAAFGSVDSPVARDWDLLHRQHADGSWSPDREVIDALGVDRSVFDGMDDVTARVAMTRLVLAHMDRSGAVPDSWQPALSKSRAWLAGRPEPAPAAHDDWESFVRAVLPDAGTADA